LNLFSALTVDEVSKIKNMSKDKRKENLIPGSHKLTAEERSRGGINSAQSRREKRRSAEIAEDILSMTLRPEDIPKGIELTDADIKTGIIAMLARSALDGKTKSAEIILSLIGEYSQKMDINNTLNIEDASTIEMEEYFARGGIEDR